MYNFKIRVCGGSPLFNSWHQYEFSVYRFEEFKKEFFKRFGNISGTNKASREKWKLKKSLKRANNLEEFKQAFDISDHWYFEIIKCTTRRG